MFVVTTERKIFKLRNGWKIIVAEIVVLIYGAGAYSHQTLLRYSTNILLEGVFTIFELNASGVMSPGVLAPSGRIFFKALRRMMA